MTLDGLKCLRAVVSAGSFRAAAGVLHVSQPAVSQQLKALERELGHQLVDRRTCSLTPPGEAVFERATRLLDEAEALQREAADLSGAGIRALRVGTSDTNALYFLPTHIRTFAERMPHVRLTVMARSSDAVAELVRDGDLDVGIVTLPQEDPALETRLLFEQRLVVVARKGHALEELPETSLDALRDEAFVLLHEDTRTGHAIARFFEGHAFVPLTAVASGSFEVIKRYVAEGIGLSILPEMVLTEDDDKHLIQRPLPGLPQVAIGAVWRKNAYQTKAANAFLDVLNDSNHEGTKITKK